MATIDDCPRDCVYRKRIGGHTDYCAYWEIAGKMRGCDPGKGCKRYDRKKHGRATWDIEVGRTMFEDGKTCREISRALGVEYDKVWACVRRWRKDAQRNSAKLHRKH